MKVALVYDWIHTFGGAERILLQLKKMFPNSLLYTSVYDSIGASWAKDFDIRTSFLQHFPLAKKHHELYPVLTPLAFESFDFSSFDLVISVTSSDAKGIITKPETLHICYLLTPTRYLWSHEDYYFNNRLLNLIRNPFTNYLKKWDLVAKTRPDNIVAISRTVQKRIKEFYNFDSQLIYPPVRVNFLTRQKINSTREKDYFLVVARLVPYKRIDLVIKVCNKLRLSLIVVGSGRSYHKLKQMAGPTIKFIGNLTEDELISYYQNCRALIVPSEEDFGIVAVEAMALGKPVIAYQKGGISEIVKKGVTGELFSLQTEIALTRTLSNFQERRYSKEMCIKFAKKYDEDIFNKKFSQHVENVWQKHQKRVLT